jgi:hypothetical protein
MVYATTLLLHELIVGGPSHIVKFVITELTWFWLSIRWAV